MCGVMEPPQPVSCRTRLNWGLKKCMKKVERKKASAIGAGFGLEQCFSSLFFNYFLKSETSSFGLKACLCVAKSQIPCLLLDRIANSSTCEEGGMVTRREPFALLLPWVSQAPLPRGVLRGQCFAPGAPVCVPPVAPLAF